MDVKTFEGIVMEQIGRCTDTLIQKAKEYATEDRLHNFKVAAGLQQCTLRQAIAGMMAKHTTSVYDMCISRDKYTMELWNEKITDHINYLLLLRAILEEE